MTEHMKPRRTAFYPVGLMCMVLAVGLAIALCTVTFAMVYEAIAHPESAGLSENATQVLTGWGGGILGVLGAFVGYAIGTKNDKPPQTPGGVLNVLNVPEPPEPPEPYRAMPAAPPGQQGPGTGPPKRRTTP